MGWEGFVIQDLFYPGAPDYGMLLEGQEFSLMASLAS